MRELAPNPPVRVVFLIKNRVRFPEAGHVIEVSGGLRGQDFVFGYDADRPSRHPAAFLRHVSSLPCFAIGISLRCPIVRGADRQATAIHPASYSCLAVTAANSIVQTRN